MANKFTRFLKQVGKGLTNPKGVMGNFQHATRLYVDNTYRLSPRTRFMYYVQFEIDPTAHKATQFSNRKHATEIGYLIKTTDLPKFNIDQVTKNQYNRKKLIYKQINYEPINMKFHDDNAGVMNALWAIYYGTYFADRHNPAAAFTETKYRAEGVDAFNNFRYGLDNNKTVDMFKSISIYTMSRRRYLGYKLINPRIKSWSHGSLDNSANDTLENEMSIEYESVSYSAGQVSFDNPKGFATLHYDTVPSPLSVQGGGVANLLGSGGVLDGLESIFGDVASGTAFGSLGGFIGTAIKANNTYKNFKALSKESVKGELINVITSPEAIRGAVNTIGGVVGAVFPKNNTQSQVTTASSKSLVGDGGP